MKDVRVKRAGFASVLWYTWSRSWYWPFWKRDWESYARTPDDSLKKWKANRRVERGIDDPAAGDVTRYYDSKEFD